MIWSSKNSIHDLSFFLRCQGSSIKIEKSSYTYENNFVLRSHLQNPSSHFWPWIAARYAADSGDGGWVCGRLLETRQAADL